MYRPIDRSKKFKQNSQNYLIPDKTEKSDVLGNNRQYQFSNPIILSWTNEKISRSLWVICF